MEDRPHKISSNYHASLPEDVVVEILSRLPVKSLIRFKCICKSWYEIIGSPGFIKKHFTCDSNHTRLLLQYETADEEELVWTLFLDEKLSAREDFYVDLLDEVDIFGPVDGLFLLQNGQLQGDRVALWNPATREYYLLPKPQHTWCVMPPYMVSHAFGFGLDPLTDDYKIVWICLSCNEKVGSQAYAAVFSLHNKTWRFLDSQFVPGYCLSSTDNVFINGVYYWQSDNPNEFRIVSFDMGTEVFKEIEPPKKSESQVEPMEMLSLYNGSLVLLRWMDTYGGEFSIDVWIMREEGSWVKHLSVKPSIDVLMPLGFWKSNELFLVATHPTPETELVLYNFYTHQIRKLGIQKSDLSPLVIFNYKESLVSVRGQDKDRTGPSCDMVRFFKTDPPVSDSEAECDTQDNAGLIV